VYKPRERENVCGGCKCCLIPLWEASRAPRNPLAGLEGALCGAKTWKGEKDRDERMGNPPPLE